MLASYRRSLLVFGLLILVTALARPNEAYGQQRGGQAQIAAAMSNLAYAQTTVDRLKDRAERALAHDKNWVAAKEAVKAAEKNRDAVREQTRQQTMAKPEYQALARVLEQNASETQVADARMKMANMVWDDQQSSSDCTQAKARLNEANAEVDARWKDYETRVLVNDPDWNSAIAARDSARTQLSAVMTPQRSGNARMSASGGSSRGGYGRSSRGSSSGSRSMRGGRGY